MVSPTSTLTHIYRSEINNTFTLLTEVPVLADISPVIYDLSRAAITVGKLVRAEWFVDILDVHLTQADSNSGLYVQVREGRFGR